MSRSSVEPRVTEPLHETFAAAVGSPTGRRAFLKSSVSGVAALTVASWLPPLRARADDAAAGGLTFFDAGTAAVGVAIIEALTGAGRREGASPMAQIQIPKGLPHPSQTFAIQQADRACLGMHPELQQQVRLLMRIVEWSPLLVTFSFARFTRMPLEDRQMFLRGWADSKLPVLRQGFVALKMLFASFYWADPQTWEFLGYDGPRLARIEDGYLDPLLARARPADPLPILKKS